jgi:hypothetical protein
MSGGYSDEVDEEVLREILEYEKRYAVVKKRSYRRRSYPPTGKQLAEAVARAAVLFYGHPDDFPDFVFELLESEGFDTSRVTVKRVWRTYEELVRRKIIGDRLGVVVWDERG